MADPSGKTANATTERFCRLVRTRTAEHRVAVRLLFDARIYGQIVSVLRQELDSMVRVIFLLSIDDHHERNQLMKTVLDGGRWPIEITDAQMVDLADSLHGWTRSVYRFGCAFIHLSAMHQYGDRDPMGMISMRQRRDIVEHVQNYHGVSLRNPPKLEDILRLLPQIFDKIAGNLECYIRKLEEGGNLEPHDLGRR